MISRRSFKHVFVFLAGMALSGAMSSVNAAPAAPSTTLWYARPAKDWQHEDLPIGNGRLGAMVFGGVLRERIALNEDTVWSGMRTDWNRKDAHQEKGQAEMTISIPANSSATVYLPCRGDGEVAEGGTPVASAPGVQSVARQADACVLEVGSGTYCFSFPI